MAGEQSSLKQRFIYIYNYAYYLAFPIKTLCRDMEIVSPKAQLFLRAREAYALRHSTTRSETLFIE